MNDNYQTSADWLRYRRHWLRSNKPNHEGYYACGICGRWVSAEEVTLDHIEPRNAENMFLDSNIQPAHGYCNYIKGSQRWQPKVSKEAYDFLSFLSNL